MFRMLVKDYARLVQVSLVCISKYSTEIFGNICLHCYVCFAYSFPTDIYLFSHLANAAVRISGVWDNFMTSLCLFCVVPFGGLELHKYKSCC